MLHNAELIDGGFCEDEVDSAIVLSPYSQYSGDPSPNPAQTGGGISTAAVSRSLASKGAKNGKNLGSNGWSPPTEQRPKAFSVKNFHDFSQQKDRRNLMKFLNFISFMHDLRRRFVQSVEKIMNQLKKKLKEN